MSLLSDFTDMGGSAVVVDGISRCLHCCGWLFDRCEPTSETVLNLSSPTCLRVSAGRDDERLAEEFGELAAPHVHELVRLKETEAMLLAARFILGASLSRTELRLSHFREDFKDRDDAHWLMWVDIEPGCGTNAPTFQNTPIPTPLCSVTAISVRPNRLKQHVQRQ